VGVMPRSALGSRPHWLECALLNEANRASNDRALPSAATNEGASPDPAVSTPAITAPAATVPRANTAHRLQEGTLMVANATTTCRSTYEISNTLTPYVGIGGQCDASEWSEPAIT
jgi:hypothetical protein